MPSRLSTGTICSPWVKVLTGKQTVNSQNDVTTYAGPTLAGREDVARKEDQRVVLLLAVDGREEPGGPAGGLGVPGLHVSAVVEMKQRNLVCSAAWQDSHRVHCGLQSIKGHR